MTLDARTTESCGRVALALIVVGALGYGHLQVIRPWRTTAGELASMRQAVTILAETAGSLDRLEQQIARTEHEIAVTEALLPRDVDIDAFLEQLGDIATAANVRLDLLLPRGEVEHRLLREMPLDLEVSGEFPAIFDFLVRLERADRLTRVEQIAVRRDGTDRRCSAQLQLGLFYSGNEG